MAERLEAVSPLGILGRGYSITTRPDDLKPIDDASQLQPGETMVTRRKQGKVASQVLEIDTEATS